MKLVRVFFLIFLFSSYKTVFAQSEQPPSNELNLIAEENKIEILPQKFEYEIVNDQTLRLGDRNLQSDLFSVKLLKSPSGKTSGLSLEWPSLFLEKTVLKMRNHNNETLSEALHEQNASEKNSEKSSFRYLFDSNFVQNLRKLPFFRVCFSQAENETYFEVCSAPFSLVESNGQESLLRRKSTFSKTSLNLDFKEVENKGLVILNDPKRTLQLRLEFLTGEFLQGELKHKPVQYVDVKLVDKNKISLVAEGTQPVNSAQVEMLTKERWRTLLSIERPTVYLLGAMGVPMRQDFELHQIPLPSSFRPKMLSFVPQKTYSSKLTLRGKFSSSQTQLKTIDPRDSLAVNGDFFEWTIRGISSDSRRRNLLLTTKNGNYQIGFSVEKKSRSLLSLIGKVEPQSKKSLIGFEAQTWFEDLGLSSFRHLFGLELRFLSELNKPADEYKSQSAQARWISRFHRGTFLDSSHLDGQIIYHQEQTESLTTQHPGIALTWTHAQSFLGSQFQKIGVTQILSPLNKSNSDQDLNPRLKSLIGFESQLYYPIGNSWLSHLNIGYQVKSYEPVNPKTTSSASIGFGLGLMF